MTEDESKESEREKDGVREKGAERRKEHGNGYEVTEAAGGAR